VRRINIIDFYIAREVAIPVALSVGIITVALIVERLLKLVDLIVNQGVSLTEVLTLLGYLIPTLLVLGLPMAMLLGVLLGIGRMSGDHEFIAARACGFSLNRLALPVIALAVALYPIEVLMATKIAPLANARLHSQILQLMRTRATSALTEKVFNHNFGGVVIYFDRSEPPGTKLFDVLISDNRDPSAKSVIFAHTGLLLPHTQDAAVTLRLLDGWIFGAEGRAHGQHIARFEVYDINVSPNNGLSMAERSPLEMSTEELRIAIGAARARGQPNIPAEIERAHRWTFPAAIFPFVVIGMVLGLTRARRGRPERFASAIALFFCYYVLMNVGEALATAGKLDAYLGASVPDLFFTVVAIILFRRSADDLKLPVASLNNRLRRWLQLIELRLRSAG
jgi:lipopolysaccharide export system permease protein